MAHEITEKDSFGYVGRKAWHGLGIELPSGLTAQEAFEKLGLGWETELHPVPALTLPDGRKVTANDHRMHVRLDTATLLGVVGKDYQPVSNQEMANFADILAGEDRAITVETGGSLRGGKRVFVLIKLPKDIIVTDDDVVRNYVCLSNGHDGINSFNVFSTPIRVVCANTLGAAEAGLVKGTRFAHTGDIQGKVEEARKALGIMVHRSESFQKVSQRLAQVSLRKAEITDYFDDVYGRTYGEETTEKHQTEVKSTWAANLQNPLNTVKSTEGSLWHAYNAITFYHDHQRGRFKSVHESDGRIHSNLFGASSKAKQIAFRQAVALIPG